MSAPLRAAGGLGVPNGFTTRVGGCSVGATASLNLAVRGGDPPSSVAENWRRVVASVRPDLDVSRLALLHQVHGADVVRVDAPSGPLAVVAEADGAVTIRRDVVLAVRVADCVPILLAAPGGVGVAHAGWRGTASGVLAATVRALCDASGASPGQVRVAIGPCIGAARYEVGDEVVAGIVASGVPPSCFVTMGPRGRPHVDLVAAVRWQAAALGVAGVEVVAGDTSVDPDLYSHRRDGPETGRFAGVVARVGP